MVLIDESKIVGRCLLWNVNLNGAQKKYADRIYFINKKSRKIFYDYFRNNNILSRDLDANLNLKMEINLDNIDFSDYPFMDTFKYIDIENKLIANHFEPHSNFKRINQL